MFESLKIRQLRVKICKYSDRTMHLGGIVLCIWAGKRLYDLEMKRLKIILCIT
jgi:hypothetical protein